MALSPLSQPLIPLDAAALCFWKSNKEETKLKLIPPALPSKNRNIFIQKDTLNVTFFYLTKQINTLKETHKEIQVVFEIAKQATN